MVLVIPLVLGDAGTPQAVSSSGTLAAAVRAVPSLTAATRPVPSLTAVPRGQS